jgi:hypothetical protein
MKTTFAIVLLVSALFTTTLAIAGNNCRTVCKPNYNGQGYTCDTSCY